MAISSSTPDARTSYNKGSVNTQTLGPSPYQQFQPTRMDQLFSLLGKRPQQQQQAAPVMQQAPEPKGPTSPERAAAIRAQRQAERDAVQARYLADLDRNRALETSDIRQVVGPTGVLQWRKFSPSTGGQGVGIYDNRFGGGNAARGGVTTQPDVWRG